MKGFRLKNIIVILISIAYCLLTIVFVGCKNKKATIETVTKKELWACSMHPEIIRDKPGICPICGMDLVRKVKDGIAVNDLELNDLLQPTDRFVVSSIPVITIKKRSELIEVAALGTVAYDTRLVSTISAWVSGRIEKLYVRYRYQRVNRGQKIMDIYSPDLLTTQQELLFFIKNDPDNASLINAAKQKLLLLGMSEGQLQQIIKSGRPSLTVSVYSNYSGHIHEAGNIMPGLNEQEERMPARPSGGGISRITEELTIKEGMYVEKGQNIFQLYDVSKSWILLSIFPEYVSLVKTGDAVRVVPETAPAKNFRAKIDFIEPLLRKENKTVTARVYFNNSQLQIPIGSQVSATVFVNSKELNWLPKDAVLSIGIGKVVFLKTGGGFKAQKIETGLTYKDRIQIISGLSQTDTVAANAQFLIDSESFIKLNHQP